MSASSESADQLVRMGLQGSEYAIRLSGEAAKQVAVLIYTILKQEKKTKGRARLENMLRSGKELKVFTLRRQDLQVFCREARRYGVLYCVLRDKNKDGIVDLMVRAEDASKINRVCERFRLAAVDAASIKAEIVRSREQSAKAADEPPAASAQQDIDKLFDELEPEELPKPIQQNPTQEPQQPEPLPSGRGSKTPSGEQEVSESRSRRGREPKEKPSVRQELEEIKAEQQKILHRAPGTRGGRTISRKPKEVTR